MPQIKVKILYINLTYNFLMIGKLLMFHTDIYKLYDIREYKLGVTESHILYYHKNT